jgi:hypothetical protein
MRLASAASGEIDSQEASNSEGTNPQVRWGSHRVGEVSGESVASDSDVGFTYIYMSSPKKLREKLRADMAKPMYGWGLCFQEGFDIPEPL